MRLSSCPGFRWPMRLLTLALGLGMPMRFSTDVRLRGAMSAPAIVLASSKVGITSSANTSFAKKKIFLSLDALGQRAGVSRRAIFAGRTDPICALA